MKPFYLVISFAVLCASCIPLRTAPKIADHKTITGKRFNKELPKKQLFVFEDPKDEGAFYDFVNISYGLEDYYVDVGVPFVVSQKAYYFSFYEVEKQSKALNLLPILMDVSLNAALGNDDFEVYTATSENTISRKGNYYIAIEVYDDAGKDCLEETYLNNEQVLNYLRSLKERYLATENYHEIVFKNQ